MLLALASASLLAQAATQCSNGFGARFGLLGFSCANCGFETRAEGHTNFLLNSELVVTNVRAGSALATGDVIVAVDNLPITTEAGAERFAYPPAGTHDVSVRRGRECESLHVDVGPACRSSSLSRSSSTDRGTVSAASGVVRAPMLGGDTLVVINGSGQVGAGGAPIGRFGFGVECRNTRTSTRQPNGNYVYKYERYPVIVAVRAGSITDRTGLHVGDEIISINGRSILSDDALQGPNGNDELKMVVRREGKNIIVLLLMTY